MKDADCVQFLQSVCPQLRMRWAGFRKVRRQVCKRIDRRLKALGLSGIASYSAYLNSHREEWEVLDSLCRISISRFCRDQDVFDFLTKTVFLDLARSTMALGQNTLNCWSVGCASGEEPYTLSILSKVGVFTERLPEIALDVVATDADPHLLERAKSGCYPASSLRDLPPSWISSAFERVNDSYSIRERFREGIHFLQQDIRKEWPAGPFQLILCRNLVFTYFEPALQREVLSKMLRRLVARGVIVIGRHESLPPEFSELEGWNPSAGVYRIR
ncbi:MAG: CheR family methyltransferase [Acidiferrobacterales bacterium]